MRVLIAAAVLFVLGTVGFVVLRERGKTRVATGAASDSSADVATISTGDRVDIEAHVPRQGLTIVEFTADF